MIAVRRIAGRGMWLVLVASLLCGCAGTIRIPQHLGIRPDEPYPKKVDACAEYMEYIKYAQDLQEAYHSRASHNRGWIYVAGLLGLGVTAASGGLAAAGAAGVGTLALLSISGGVSAGAFATLNNSDLSDIYTISANRVDKALAEVRKTGPASDSKDHAACKTALDELRTKVSEARTKLEEARTDSAKGAVMRAAAQVEQLKELKKKLDESLK